MRSLEVFESGSERPLDTFVHDCRMMADVAVGGGQAQLRLWQPESEYLSVGRFHRFTPCDGIARRLSGGKVLALRPGILGLTLCVPDAAWFDSVAPVKRPEQILNRALRPLLVFLESHRLDPFYPGLDTITLGDGKPLGFASFGLMPDGVVLIHQYVAMTIDFRSTEDLLKRLDPDGVIATSCASAESSVRLDASVSELGETRSWSSGYVDACSRVFRCSAESVDGSRQRFSDEFGSVGAFTRLNEEIGRSDGFDTACFFDKLGVVEVAARIENGEIEAFEMTGDFISTPSGLIAISNELVGARAAGPELRRRILRVLSRPDVFVLGALGLDDAAARLVDG